MFVGGSRSGSAAAVAASLCAAAIGTETTGPIIGPSCQNGIVGIKPTAGLVSRSGTVPITFSRDTAGPMARTAADAAVLLGALTGADERNDATLAERRALRDYHPFLGSRCLSRARIGIPRYDYKHPDKERLAIAEGAIEASKSSGVTVIDPVSLPCAGVEWTRNVLQCEFKPAVNRCLSSLPPDAPIRSLQEVIAYNERHAERALKYGQDVLLRAETKSGTLTEQADRDSVMQNAEMARTRSCSSAMRTSAMTRPEPVYGSCRLCGTRRGRRRDYDERAARDLVSRSGVQRTRIDSDRIRV